MSVRRQLSQQALQEWVKRAQPLTQAFDNAASHVVITDAGGNVVYANRKVSEVTGFSQEEIIGRNPGDLWGGQMPKEFWAKVWDTISHKKQPFIGEVQNKRKDGTLYWQEIHITPILDDQGEVRFFLGFEPDITDRKKKEEFQKQFLSAVSHQLTSPLQAVSWGLEWLGDEANLTDDQKSMLNQIYGKNRAMVDLIGDLLTLSRIGGKTDVQKEKVDLVALIDKCVTGVREQYPSVAVSVRCQSCTVETMPSLATQVITNVLSNAAKYARSSAPSVVVELTVGDRIRMSCCDNGIGIPAGEQAKVFTHGFRASNAKASSANGSGIGLSVAKMIADYLQWQMSFESIDGKGTTFMIDIPLWQKVS